MQKNNIQAKTGTELFSPLKTIKLTYWPLIIKVSLISLIFWIVQFVLQYFWLSRGEIGGSFVRSFALAGMTLISLSLFMSTIFKWWPRTAVHWRLRRYVGVAGFVFSFFHVQSALYFYFKFDLKAVYYSLNPLKNPLIFGAIAYPIFFVMALTSSDWAVRKLTPKVWKTIHRFVYIAFISSIFHFITINPKRLDNPPGYLLLFTTFFALFGQLYWYIKISSQKRFRSIGSFVGLTIIIVTLIVTYLVYTNMSQGTL